MPKLNVKRGIEHLTDDNLQMNVTRKSNSHNHLTLLTQNVPKKSNAQKSVFSISEMPSKW